MNVDVCERCNIVKQNKGYKHDQTIKLVLNQALRQTNLFGKENKGENIN